MLLKKTTGYEVAHELFCNDCPEPFTKSSKCDSGNSLEINSGDNIILMPGPGYVGIGTYNPSAGLEINGAIATTSQRTAFLATNTALTLDVGNRSFRILDNTTAVDKTMSLSDGLADGQRLTILVRNSGSGIIIFVDNPAVK